MDLAPRTSSIPRYAAGSGLPYSPKVFATIVHHVDAPGDLRSLSLVCHAFLPLSLKKLWAIPRFPNYHPHFTQFIATLSSRRQTLPYASFVEVLNLEGLGSLVQDPEFQVLSGCHRVRSLQIPECTRIESSTLQNTLYQFHKLRGVDFQGLSTTVTDGVITALAQSNPELQGVNLSRCVLLTNTALISLANHCGDNLREAHLQGLPLIGAFGIRKLVAKSPNLRTLDLRHCTWVDDSIGRLIWTWTSLNHLRKLSFSGCFKLTEQMVPGLDDPPPNEPWYDGIAPQRASIPTPIIQNLRNLDLTDCHVTDGAIKIIALNSRNLRVLNLKNCRLLTDASLEAISNIGGSIQQLILCRLPEVTDDGVKAIASKCRKLTSLDLSECTKLTDASVQHCSTLSRIESLRFNSNENISDAGVISLGNLRRPSLKRLHLSYCKRITQASIHRLLSLQPQLTHISLSGIPSFLDESDAELKRLSNAAEKGWKPEAFRVYSGDATISALRNVLEKRHSSTSRPIVSQSATTARPPNRRPPSNPTPMKQVMVPIQVVAPPRETVPLPPAPTPPQHGYPAWLPKADQERKELVEPRRPTTVIHERALILGSTGPIPGASSTSAPPPPPPVPPPPRRSSPPPVPKRVTSSSAAPLTLTATGSAASARNPDGKTELAVKSLPSPPVVAPSGSSNANADANGKTTAHPSSSEGSGVAVVPSNPKPEPNVKLLEGEKKVNLVVRSGLDAAETGAEPIPRSSLPVQGGDTSEPWPTNARRGPAGGQTAASVTVTPTTYPPPPASVKQDHLRPSYPPPPARSTPSASTAQDASAKRRSSIPSAKGSLSSPVPPPPPSSTAATTTTGISNDTSEPDPNHLSGSISSFEDLEDTSYDILDSDLGSSLEDDDDDIVDYASDFFDANDDDGLVRVQGTTAGPMGMGSAAGSSVPKSSWTGDDARRGASGLGSVGESDDKLATTAHGRGDADESGDESDYECVEIPDRET